MSSEEFFRVALPLVNFAVIKILSIICCRKHCNHRPPSPSCDLNYYFGNRFAPL